MTCFSFDMTKIPRTQRADGATTRANILEVAGQQFAQWGYSGTTSKAICAEAGTDLAAINYHFGNREGLYRAVLIESHKQFVSLGDLEFLAQSDRPPREKLGVLIDSLVARLLDKQSWHARVYAREILAPSLHFTSLVDEAIVPKFRVIRGILSEITGIPVEDPALLRCVVSIVAPCLMMQVVDQDTPNPIQALLKHNAEDLSSHLKCFALAGLDAIRAARS